MYRKSLCDVYWEADISSKLHWKIYHQEMKLANLLGLKGGQMTGQDESLAKGQWEVLLNES